MFGKGTRDGRTAQEETEESGATRRTVLQALAAGAFAAPAVGQLDTVAASSIGRPGGPVVIMGFDSEDGAGNNSNHGTAEDHSNIVQAVLDETRNGEEGLLVLGASDDTSKRAYQFWKQDIEDNIDAEVTLVDGADNIRNADFEDYAMIAVATVDGLVHNSWNDIGLTNAENDAVIDRRDDIAEFVNDGGGLLGKTQEGLDRAWEYIDPIGEFDVVPDTFEDIQVTDEGKELNITQDGMDMCCYHDVFLNYPDFFNVLITHDDPDRGSSNYVGEAVVLGGFEVVLLPEVNIEVEGPTAVEVGSTHDYEIELQNVGDDVEEENVDLEVTLEREGGIEPGDLTLSYQSEEIELVHENDALTGRLGENIDLVQDYNQTFELEATFADEGIASRQFTIEAEAVGIGSEEDTYASGDITILTSWRSVLDTSIQASPVYRDGQVYIGADDGIIYAFGHETGAGPDELEIGGEIVATPLFYEDSMYVGSTSGHLSRRDADTHAVDWERTLDAGIHSSLSLAYGSLFVATEDGTVAARDPDTGAVEWDHNVGAEIYTSPTVIDGKVFVGADDGTLSAIDAVTGEEVWSYETGATIRSSPTYSDETIDAGVVVVGSDDRSVYGLNADDGTVRWSFSTGGAVQSSPTILDSIEINDTVTGLAIVGSDDETCYAIDIDTGDEVWAYEEADGPIRSSPVVAGDLVYFGADDGLVHSVTLNRGLIVWAFDTAEDIDSGSPTIARGNLFIGSNSGHVFGVDAGLAADVRGRCSRSRLGTIGGHDDPEPRPLFQLELTETRAALPDTLACEVALSNIGDAADEQTVELVLACDDGETVLDSAHVEVGAETETTVSLGAEYELGGNEDCDIVVRCEDDSDQTPLRSHLATFDVEITATNVPPITEDIYVIEGQPLEATVRVDNSDGETDGTQPISLTANGTERDSGEVTLAVAETDTVELTWETEDGDAGGDSTEYTVTVASYDDTDEIDVPVLTTAEATVLLSQYVASLGVSGGVERSLQQILAATITAFERDNDHAALNQLHGFTRRVEMAAETGDLSGAEAEATLGGAQWIFDGVGAGSDGHPGTARGLLTRLQSLTRLSK